MQMKPLTVTNPGVLNMPQWAKATNAKILEWISVDKRFERLLRREEKRGRFTMSIKGIGNPPRVPA